MAQNVAHDEFDALFALGANFFSQGQFKKAQIIFAGLIALDNESEEASIAYGQALLMDGQRKLAVQHFLRAKKRFMSAQIEAFARKAFLAASEY